MLLVFVEKKSFSWLDFSWKYVDAFSQYLCIQMCNNSNSEILKGIDLYEGVMERRLWYFWYDRINETISLWSRPPASQESAFRYYIPINSILFHIRTANSILVYIQTHFTSTLLLHSCKKSYYTRRITSWEDFPYLKTLFSKSFSSKTAQYLSHEVSLGSLINPSRSPRTAILFQHTTQPTPNNTDQMEFFLKTMIAFSYSIASTNMILV